jgi:peptide/nickel transport system substrate-binding protein
MTARLPAHPRRCRRHSVVAAVVVLATAACATTPAAPRTDLVVAMQNGPTSLDPGIALDEAAQKLQQLLFNSLLKIDEHLRVVPDLATRFEARDPMTYAAGIPAGVHFHDGREMTSADVAFTFRRFLDPAFVSGRKGAYGDLASVEVLGRYEVAFHLKRPSASFPINLVMSIVPAGTGPEAGRHPIGSGPYRLREFVADDHVTLEPFAGYFRGAPANGGLTFKVVPDETMRGLELRKGSVDLVVNDLSPDLVATLRETPRLQVVTAPGTDYAYLGFNLRDPVLADLRVREAIGAAIDVDAIVKYLRRGLAQPATTLVPPMSWAHADDIVPPTHDASRARALLDAAGHPDPGGGRPRLHLTLKTSTSEPYRVQAAVIQHDLQEAGIDCEIRTSEFSTLMADVLNGNVQLYTLQWVGVTDPDILRRVFHSSQVAPVGFNRGYYRNAEVDRLIDEATAASAEAERGRLYEMAERAIAHDAPYVSLWYRINTIVAQSNLTGLALTPTAEFTFLANVTRRR